MRTVERADSLDSHVLTMENFKKMKPAEFSGGIGEFYKYISRKMKFPKEAKNQKVHGKVMVQFIIDTVGHVKKEAIKVINSLLESCDKEAV